MHAVEINAVTTDDIAHNIISAINSTLHTPIDVSRIHRVTGPQGVGIMCVVDTVQMDGAGKVVPGVRGQHVYTLGPNGDAQYLHRTGDQYDSMLDQIRSAGMTVECLK